MWRCLTHVVAALIVLLATPSVGQDLGRIGLPLLVSIPTAPVPVRADGTFRLVYELHMTNTGSKPLVLNRVEVWGSAKLAVMEGSELSKAIKPTAADPKEPRTMGPGAHVVVMMWVSLDTLPEMIKHRLEGMDGSGQEPLVLESPAVPVRGTPVRIAPPVRADRWLAANGPSNDTHHRRSWLAYGGRALFPERFAIDFVRLHEDSPTNGDPAENRSWRGYGAEVIAVANVRVASIKDGIPRQCPGKSCSVWDDARDNGRQLGCARSGEGSVRVLRPSAARIDSCQTRGPCS